MLLSGILTAGKAIRLCPYLIPAFLLHLCGVVFYIEILRPTAYLFLVEASEISTIPPFFPKPDMYYTH